MPWGKKAKLKPNLPPGRVHKPPSTFAEESQRLFERIAEESLHGDREMFDSLSEHEQQVVIQWLSEAIVDGQPYNAIHSALWEIDYTRKPVDIETFISDDYYFGRVLANLHPYWVNDLKTVFRPNTTVAEWILTGAIGVGKTTVAMAALGYKLQCLACLRDPPSYYGLLPDSLIVFGLYSVTKRQVADTGYFKLRGWIDTSPYFKAEFKRSAKIDSKIDFKPTGKKIQVLPGSRSLHALGLDLYSFSMDEANFFHERQDKDRGILVGQAYELYNATHTRIVSRFVRPGGTIPGIMLLMSSRKAQTSFLEDRLKKVKDAEHTYVSDYSLWQVKTKKYILPRFDVEVGDRITRSRILKKDEESRPGVQVVRDIPGEFRTDFEEDIDQALRDVAGVATFNISPLVRDRQSVFDAIREELVHPFTKPVITIDYQDDVMIEEYFTLSSLCRIEESRWVPRLNPNHVRFIHADQSKSGDCTGLAMAHVSGKVRTSKMNPDGTFSIVEHPFVIVDFMLRITPPPGSEIALFKNRAFILYLSKLFPVAKVTADGWMCVDFCQLLKKAGLDAKVQSIDKKDTPYLALRSAHFDRRIAMYRYEPYIDEVLDLERDVKKEKVDHPTKATKGGKGSSDVSDAVCGAVYACITDERAIAGVPLFEGTAEKVVRRVVDPRAASRGKRQAERRIKKIGGRVVDFDELREF